MFHRSRHMQWNFHFIHVTQTGQGPNRERCTLRPVPAGWIPQGGGRPRLWRSLVTFWRQKVTPAERPRRGAGLRLRNRRRTIPPTRRCGLCIPRLAPERRGKSRSRRRTSSPHAVAPPLPTKPACAGLWRGPHHAGPPPFTQGRHSAWTDPDGLHRWEGSSTAGLRFS